MSGEQQGRRYPDVPNGLDAHERMEPGGYRRVTYPKLGTRWEATTPSGLEGNLSEHEVSEHEDGTITVSPSILINAGARGSWHGFLERGVWRSA